MEGTMASTSRETSERRSRIVLVVGLDLGDTSQHLLGTVRELTHGSDEAELHLVHVVPPETFSERLTEPVTAQGIAERARVQIAHWEIERLCKSLMTGAVAHIVVHTPVGQPVEQLRRLAGQLGADAIVVEAHEGTGVRHMLHRSVAAGLAKSAPCSVLTVRAHHPVAVTRPT
jgi:nucleotide-binding universal stress UspA family protein